MSNETNPACDVADRFYGLRAKVWWHRLAVDEQDELLAALADARREGEEAEAKRCTEVASAKQAKQLSAR